MISGSENITQHYYSTAE